MIEGNLVLKEAFSVGGCGFFIFHFSFSLFSPCFVILQPLKASTYLEVLLWEQEEFWVMTE